LKESRGLPIEWWWIAFLDYRGMNQTIIAI